MPNCRGCHRKIERLDKDICPFCGTPNPIPGSQSLTVDITGVISGAGVPKDELPRACSRKRAFTLCALFGFLGIHAFYVKKPKQALFFVLFSLFLIGGVGSLLFFFVLPGSIWAFLIPVFVQIMFQMIFAFHYLTSEDLKDGVGELMH